MLRISINTVLKEDRYSLVALEIYDNCDYCFMLSFNENKKILKSCSKKLQEYYYTKLEKDLIDKVINGQLHIPEEVDVRSIYLCIPNKTFKSFKDYIENYFRTCFACLEKLNAERTDVPKEIVEMQQLKTLYNLKNYLGDL